MRAKGVLLELFGRLPGLVERAVEGLSQDDLAHAPAPGANTIGWLVWHLTRIQDDHVAEVAGRPQVWEDASQDDRWAARFGLPDGTTDTGYGHTPEQVAAVRPETPDVLLAYYAAVHERTLTFLEGLSDGDLDGVVDERWDPPVTLAVRLASVASDDLQHAGQAAYVRGLLHSHPR